MSGEGPKWRQEEDADKNIGMTPVRDGVDRQRGLEALAHDAMLARSYEEECATEVQVLERLLVGARHRFATAQDEEQEANRRVNIAFIEATGGRGGR